MLIHTYLLPWQPVRHRGPAASSAQHRQRCDPNANFQELGYVSLAEVQSLHGRLGFPVERDLHFTASKPISSYAREARAAERIVT
ncbi:MAG: DUF2958 domain-containing protein [Thiobacillus sp.]|nr:DUF2958 domain-containing protein [Thiobacillus sp.]QLQ01927.1 MAG: DUF2958 domain-containing protein [Thiobacillus sp.]